MTMAGGDLVPWAAMLASWTLTFLVHSTLLVGLVWLVCRLATAWSFRAKNFLWRVALVGAVASTSAQALVSLDLPRWTLEIGEHARGVPRRTHALVAERALGMPRALTAIAVPREPAERAPLAATAPFGRRLAAASLAALVLGVWSLALAALVRLGLRLLALRRLLARRTEVPTGDPLWGVLDELRAVAGVRRAIRLSHSSEIGSPAALGRREIIVPTALLAQVAPASRRAALAHELAHLEHGDPGWLRLALALEAALAFQPLLRLARAQLQTSGEYAADDWAVRVTGNGLELARALAEAARGAEDRVAALVPCMAARPGGLVHRVERLLADPSPRANEIGLRHVGLALVGIAALGACAPAVSHRALDGTPPSGPTRRTENYVLASDPGPASAPRPAPQVRPAPEAGPAAPDARPAPAPSPAPAARAAQAAGPAPAPKPAPNPRPASEPARERAPVAPLEPRPAAAPGAPPQSPAHLGLPPPPRPPAPRVPPQPRPHPAEQLGRELGVRARDVERLGLELQKAHGELERLRAKRASDSELAVAERQLERREEELDAASDRLDEASEAFTREVEAWSEAFAAQMEEWAHGEEMQRWERDMEKWSEELGARIAEEIESEMDLEDEDLDDDPHPAP